MFGLGIRAAKQLVCSKEKELVMAYLQGGISVGVPIFNKRNTSLSIISILYSPIGIQYCTNTTQGVKLETWTSVNLYK